MKARSALKQTVVTSLNRFSRSPRVAAASFSLIALHKSWERSSDELRFLAFCGSMRHLAHGQLLQDLWVLYELDLMPSGYFVEFGAYDGSRHSNTKLLEDRFGWNGLLVEPNPAVAHTLRLTRSAIVDGRCVWDVSGDTVELVVTGDAELSTVADHAGHDLHSDTRRATAVRRVAVRSVSLNDLLDEYSAPKVIDFLSVDTEGTELRILGIVRLRRTEAEARCRRTQRPRRRAGVGSAAVCARVRAEIPQYVEMGRLVPAEDMS